MAMLSSEGAVPAPPPPADPEAAAGRGGSNGVEKSNKSGEFAHYSDILKLHTAKNI